MKRRAPIFRVQDQDGRGPFKLGVTRLWADFEGTEQLPTYLQEFGDTLLKRIDRMRLRRGAFGCGCSSILQINRWFTETERPKLIKLGYVLVSMHVDEVLAESASQIVFWRELPLSEGVLIMPWDYPSNAA